jgi:serine/threonine-protein kinase
MARVWRAVDTQTGDEVAIKRLHPIAFADEASRRRLSREFIALRSLRHPNIVGVRDLELHDDDAALVLDYVAGPTVADRMPGEGRPLPVDEAVSIASGVAAALDYAHRSGVIHRDVKPANIVLGPDGRALLVDFGIAHAEAAETAITATNQVTGTFRYMAPEQLRGQPATPSSDIFGLAAVTYEMLAGRPPFDGSTPLAVAEAQALGAPPIEGVLAGLDVAVRRALDPDPASRPADARAFAESLVAALDDAPTVAIPAVAAAAGAATASHAVAGSAGRPTRSGRRPTAAVLGAAAALIVALVVLAAQPLKPAADGGDPSPSAFVGAPSPAAATPPPTPVPTPPPTPTPAPVLPEPAPPNGNGNEENRDEDDEDNSGPGKGNGKKDKDD